jgi:hypothetical protein
MRDRPARRGPGPGRVLLDVGPVERAGPEPSSRGRALGASRSCRCA